MTPEQLEQAIRDLCNSHKLSSVRVTFAEHYETGFTWAVWRGTRFEWGGSLPECLDKMRVIHGDQQQWNEERMRAGA